MIKVLFFASLREKLQCDSIELDYTDGMTLGQLKANLQNKNSLWDDALNGNILAAVDQEMATAECVLQPHCEVAFFPPVTGG